MAEEAEADAVGCWMRSRVAEEEVAPAVVVADCWMRSRAAVAVQDAAMLEEAEEVYWPLSKDGVEAVEEVEEMEEAEVGCWKR